MNLFTTLVSLVMTGCAARSAEEIESDEQKNLEQVAEELSTQGGTCGVSEHFEEGHPVLFTSQRERYDLHRVQCFSNTENGPRVNDVLVGEDLPLIISCQHGFFGVIASYNCGNYGGSCFGQTGWTLRHAPDDVPGEPESEVPDSITESFKYFCPGSEIDPYGHFSFNYNVIATQDDVVAQSE